MDEGSGQRGLSAQDRGLGRGYGVISARVCLRMAEMDGCPMVGDVIVRCAPAYATIVIILSGQ
jgi:hypothetical protein